MEIFKTNHHAWYLNQADERYSCCKIKKKIYSSQMIQ